MFIELHWDSRLKMLGVHELWHPERLMADTELC
jgi:hypothetical protein